ncbi:MULTISPECIES: hypothetical protein [Streptomyces]|uniref:hypothetical protein n=1 Tax=Streptomyces TaxID=1883 RepID=UPI00343BCB49
MTPVKPLIGTQVPQSLISPHRPHLPAGPHQPPRFLGSAANGPRYRVAATTVVVGVAGMSTVLLVQTILGRVGLG